MYFASISHFRDEISDLCKRNRDGYYSCRQDIEKTFSDLTFDQIAILPGMIFMIDQYRLIKVRIPNTALKLSKSDGFRLYIFTNNETKEVCLLSIYPKRGPKSLLSLSDAQEKRLIVHYKSEKEAGTLIVSDKLEEVL